MKSFNYRGLKENEIQIGEMKDGNKIIVNKDDFTRYEFRKFLEHLLDREITEETRSKIEEALATPMTVDEKIAEIQATMPMDRAVLLN